MQLTSVCVSDIPSVISIMAWLHCEPWLDWLYCNPQRKLIRCGTNNILRVLSDALTLWSSSNAYSKPAVKLATFSHLTDLTAAAISFLLSGVARTWMASHHYTILRGVREANSPIYQRSKAPPSESCPRTRPNWRNRHRSAFPALRQSWRLPAQSWNPTLSRTSPTGSSKNAFGMC